MLVQIQGLQNALAQTQNAHGSSKTHLSHSESKLRTFEASLADFRTQECRNLSPEAVQSTIQPLRSSYAKEVTAHKCCQLRLASAKATLMNLWKSIAEDKLLKRAIGARKKADTECSLQLFQTSLENERKALQICRQELVTAETRANEQSNNNSIHPKKLADLEIKKELHKGLVDIGIVASFAYWESAKKYCDSNGNWFQDRGSNIKSKSFIADAAKTVTARPYIAADAALFSLGFLSAETDRRMFFDMYQTQLCRAQFESKSIREYFLRSIN
ncbi:unnamed protein product [Diplocarpon coronariae]